MLPVVKAPSPRTRPRPRQRAVHYADIGALILGAGLIIGISNSQGPIPLRLILGLLMGCFGSGYSLTIAIFPARHLKPDERFGLTLIFSVAILVLSALIMSVVHVKITAPTLEIIIGGVTLVATAIAASRRWVTNELPISQLNTRIGLLAIIMATGIGLLTWFITGTYLTYRAPAFFVTNRDDLQSNYPSQVVQDSHVPLSLHITQFANRPQHYRIVISDNGHLVSQTTAMVRSHWSHVYRVPDSTLGQQKLSFFLFSPPHEKHPIRRLWLYYSVVQKPGPNP